MGVLEDEMNELPDGAVGGGVGACGVHSVCVVESE